jgi:DNA processing protein
MLFDFVKKQAPLHSDEDRMAWLRLCRTSGIGPITFYNFIDHFGSALAALEALPELAKKGNRKKPYIIPSIAQIEKEIRALEKRGGRFITAGDPEYPLSLSAIDDAPPVISVIGDINLLHQPCLGIVGARNASMNGCKFAHSLARDLGAQGQVIASGLARGIDTAAHDGALDTGTIAVVAGGIDVVYPRENQKLYERICANGLMIAENPFGTAPRAQDFPRRNRIVSGLSAGIIVVEATPRSGSLITARLSGEQGRDVYAVPGHPLDPRAAGPNNLIREGAVLVRSADDILEHVNNFSGTAPRLIQTPKRDAQAYQHDLLRPAPAPALVKTPPQKQDSHENDETARILSQLSSAPSDINELVRQTDIPASKMQSILIDLEIQGLITRMPGNRIALV